MAVSAGTRRAVRGACKGDARARARARAGTRGRARGARGARGGAPRAAGTAQAGARAAARSGAARGAPGAQARAHGARGAGVEGARRHAGGRSRRAQPARPPRANKGPQRPTQEDAQVNGVSTGHRSFTPRSEGCALPRTNKDSDSGYAVATGASDALRASLDVMLIADMLSAAKAVQILHHSWRVFRNLRWALRDRISRDPGFVHFSPPAPHGSQVPGPGGRPSETVALLLTRARSLTVSLQQGTYALRLLAHSVRLKGNSVTESPRHCSSSAPCQLVRGGGWWPAPTQCEGGNVRHHSGPRQCTTAKAAVSGRRTSPRPCAQEHSASQAPLASPDV